MMNLSWKLSDEELDLVWCRLAVHIDRQGGALIESVERPGFAQMAGLVDLRLALREALDPTGPRVAEAHGQVRYWGPDDPIPVPGWLVED